MSAINKIYQYSKKFVRHLLVNPLLFTSEFAGFLCYWTGFEATICPRFCVGATKA